MMWLLVVFLKGFLVGSFLAFISSLVLIHGAMLYMVRDDETLKKLQGEYGAFGAIYFSYLRRAVKNIPGPSHSPMLTDPIPEKESEQSFRGCLRKIDPDFPIESCRWLNTIMQLLYTNLKVWRKEDIWTNYLNELINADEEKRRLISRLKINKIALGNIAPSLSNMRPLASDSKKNELFLTSKLLFLGSINVSLQAQLHLGVSVVDVDLSVSLTEVLSQFIVSFIAGKGAICFYLGIGDDPHLTFDVNSMIGTFNDASAIRQLVTSTLKSIVKKRFVFPNGSLFTLDKDLRFMRRKTSPSSSNSSAFNANNSGQDNRIMSNLTANTPAQSMQDFVNPFKGVKLHVLESRRNRIPTAQGLLFVNVSEALNLPAADDNGFSDPYCIIKIGRTVKKSSIQFKTNFPRWNEDFTFFVYDLEKDMEIKIYDRDIVKDDFLGEVHFSLKEICIPKKDLEMQEPIKVSKKYKNGNEADPSNAAMLKTKFKWEPYTESRAFLSSIAIDYDRHWVDEEAESADPPTTLGVSEGEEDSPAQTFTAGDQQNYWALGINIWKAQDLVKMADPFCVIDCDQFPSHSTKTVKKSRNPIWNETFAFQIFQPMGKLSFKVYDWNRFTQNELIGEVSINIEDIFKGTGSSSGQAQIMTLKGIGKEPAGVLHIVLHSVYLSMAEKPFDQWYAEFFEKAWSAEAILNKTESYSIIKSQQRQPEDPVMKSKSFPSNNNNNNSTEANDNNNGKQSAAI